LDCRNDARGAVNYNSKSAVVAERIVILGAGESGVGAARLALDKGFEVFVSEEGQVKEKFRSELQIETSDGFPQTIHTLFFSDIISLLNLL